MPNIYLTSDTHFGHEKILQYCDRPFQSIDEMDATLIRNWNQTVKPEDTVWHLGDFAFKHHLDYLKQLNGRVRLILGNHDKFSRTVQEQFVEVRDLFHGRLTNNKESPLFFLFHYPLVSWAKKGNGCIHLYGHVHGRYTRPGERSLDVGVDVHRFTPLELSVAIELASANYERRETDKENTKSNTTCTRIEPIADGVPSENSDRSVGGSCS